jgi:HlyD family secretion protein
MSSETVFPNEPWPETESVSLPRTKLLRPVWILAVLVLLTLAGWWLLRGRDIAPHYLTATVSRGPVVRSVIATGTVNPVTTVQVGTYVSGPISAIYVDFNSPVKAGQLMAKIDPRPFQAQVDLANAALANASAQLRKDEANLAYQKVTEQRDAELLRQNVVSQDTMDSQVSTYDQAVAQIGLDHAAIGQQQANLKAAELNLYYTNIISPVDGTVVSRNVDMGQTVAASYQTPTLFLVAKDLTQMQVDTNVSESDVGNITNGGRGEFTVDAFPRRTFEGVVTQVRQAPITVQNVVTYDVVITVANPEQLLMPGMTANVTIVTASRDNVIRVPLQALRFSPTKAEHPANFAGAHSPRQARVWTLVDDRLTLVPVKLGLDDGDNVELLGDNLKPGDVIVLDQARDLKTAAAAPPSFASPHFPH